MKRRMASVAGIIALLSACSSGGGASTPTAGSTGTVTVAPTPTPTPTPTGACSLRARQDWAFGQLREWYLFPETLPTSLDPSPYANVSDYVDALTATARSQSRDRFFTYVTSIASENAFLSTGSSAGFGVRLSYDSASRLFIAESFEGAPALAAGIDRGAQILAIGTDATNLRTVAALVASGGADAVTDALGPSTAGLTRVLQISDAAGTRTVTVTKASYSLTPISSRYGTQIIDDAGRRVGYVNLRTFISTADAQLRNAFATFRAQGITDVIIDLRYNGGGLVSTAELVGDLLGRNRLTSDVFSFTTFRPEESGERHDPQFRPHRPIDRADTGRVYRDDQHGVGERTRHQLDDPLSARQRRADRHQHLRQAGRPDRPRPDGLRRPAPRRRVRLAKRLAPRQLLYRPRQRRAGELPRNRRSGAADGRSAGRVDARRAQLSRRAELHARSARSPA